MLYTGDSSDVCAISFTPLSDIEQPVGFDSAHAFECECIVDWLTKHRSSNPMTGECIPPQTPIASLLRPLIIIEGDNARIAKTQAVLDGAGCTIDTCNTEAAVGWKKKLGWDVVFVVLFAAANCYYRYETAIYAALLTCSTYMIYAHYRSTGRCIAATLILSFIFAFTIVEWNRMIFTDGAAVIRFIVILVFSAKLSLDFTTTVLGAPFY